MVTKVVIKFCYTITNFITKIFISQTLYYSGKTLGPPLYCNELADPTLADEDDVYDLLLLDDDALSNESKELISNSNLISANKDSNEGVDGVIFSQNNGDLISNRSTTNDSDL